VKQIAAILSIIAIALPQSAIAGNFVWEGDNGKGLRKVWAGGNVPNSTVEIKVPFILENQQPKFCGYVKTKVLPSSDGNFIYISNGKNSSNNRSYSNPLLVDAKCSTEWKNQSGTTIVPPPFFKDKLNNLFIQSLEPVNIYFYGVEKTISKKANQCGLVSFSSSTALDLLDEYYSYIIVGGERSGFNYSENRQTFCKKVGNNFIQYIPL